MTLTNRTGLVLQDLGVPTAETVYVNDLVLGSGSVLNVGLQRLYYQRLSDENGIALERDLEDPSAPLANLEPACGGWPCSPTVQPLHIDVLHIVRGP